MKPAFFNKTKTFLFYFIFIIIPGTVSFPQYQNDNNNSVNILSGRDLFTLQGLISASRTDYNTIPGGGISGIYEHFFTSGSSSSFGFGIGAGVFNIFGKDLKKNPDGFKTDITELGVDFLYSYGFSRILSLKLNAGPSLIWFNPMVEGGVKSPNNQKKVYKNLSASYNFGGGLKLLLYKGVFLSLDAGVHYVSTDYLDDLNAGKFTDYYLTGKMGISITLFNRSIPVKTVIPPNRPGHIFNKNASTDLNNHPGYPNQISGKDSSFTTNIAQPPVRKIIEIPDTLNRAGKNPKPVKKVEDLEKKLAELEKTIQDLKTKVKTPEKELAEEDKKVAALEKKLEKKEKKESSFDNKEKEPSKEKKNPVNEVSLQTDITFLQDQARIRPEAQPLLERIAGYLKKYPNTKWKIEAHVDEGNTSSKSETLSKKRANEILNYFIKKGIPAANLSITYMGDKYPIDQNSTAYGRMKNRRLEIKRTQ